LNGESLTEHINIRVTPQEREQIHKQAKLAGLTISEYTRKRIKGVYVAPKIEERMLFELRRQGGLLKYIFNESRGMYSEKTADALDTINSFAEELERKIFHDK